MAALWDRGGQVGAITHLLRGVPMQSYTLVPLMDVVWVLAKENAIEKQGPSANELLEAGQAQLQVHIIWEPNMFMNQGDRR